MTDKPTAAQRSKEKKQAKADFLKKVDLIEAASKRQLPQAGVAATLGLSERHIRRLVRTYRAKGPDGLLHKGRGRQAHNKKIPPSFDLLD
jgi:transcriptional regulator GlxA family with amidase domain